VKHRGVKRCGARTRAGHPCKRRGRGRGGRCPNHGGCSTGPKTPEGRRAVSAAQNSGGRRGTVNEVELRRLFAKADSILRARKAALKEERRAMRDAKADVWRNPKPCRATTKAGQPRQGRACLNGLCGAHGGSNRVSFAAGQDCEKIERTRSRDL
jgi:hypothetical protein